ncbi:MAG: hypothetical protein U0521_09040 [Anaerolineae bacterium]
MTTPTARATLFHHRRDHHRRAFIRQNVTIGPDKAYLLDIELERRAGAARERL